MIHLIPRGFFLRWRKTYFSKGEGFFSIFLHLSQQKSFGGKITCDSPDSMRPGDGPPIYFTENPSSAGSGDRVVPSSHQLDGVGS